ncbi:MAG: sigma-54-dependent transcriptional regulator [Pirellulaceae bacterium]
MPVVLVIDDDPMVRHWFRREFEDFGVTLELARTAGEGIDLVQSGSVDVVMLDVMLPDMSGLAAFRRIHEQDPRLPVVFITAGGESETAIEAVQLGAMDYLFKPLDRQQVRDLVTRALEIRRLMETPVKNEQVITSDGMAPDILVGRCTSMKDVYKDIGRVASQDVTVLVQGESGTGKELVARAIYQHSARADGPFLAINCAAIPEALLESELFGYEKGAFTGADFRRIGKFEQSTGGTLFLDEIGDMSASTQSKILRVLQQQRFERVGGSETIETDVRIIAATNRDLETLVALGKFRSDLYYRLNVVTITLSPLRERLTDVPLLLQHFLGRFSREMDKNVNAISPEVMDMLLRHDWPGNIREFQSVIKHAILHATGPVLLPDFMPDAVRGTRSKQKPPEENANTLAIAWEEYLQDCIASGTEDLYAETLHAMERHLLTTVLRHTNGNKLRAAKILGMTRGTLRSKMNSLRINLNQ